MNLPCDNFNQISEIETPIDKKYLLTTSNVINSLKFVNHPNNLTPIFNNNFNYIPNFSPINEVILNQENPFKNDYNYESLDYSNISQNRVNNRHYVFEPEIIKSEAIDKKEKLNEFYDDSEEENQKMKNKILKTKQNSKRKNLKKNHNLNLEKKSINNENNNIEMKLNKDIKDKNINRLKELTDLNNVNNKNSTEFNNTDMKNENKNNKIKEIEEIEGKSLEKSNSSKHKEEIKDNVENFAQKKKNLKNLENKKIKT